MEVLIKKYKRISLDILKAIKMNEDVNDLVDEREVILVEISKVNNDIDCLKKLIKDYDIESIDKEVLLAFMERKEMIKIELKELINKKNGVNAYATANYGHIYQTRA